MRGGEAIQKVMRKAFLVSSAPGRADFLNTHQDYKGLPVIPVALNLRTFMFAVGRISGAFRIVSLNLREEGEPYEDYFEVDRLSLRPGKWFGNYFRSVVLAFEDIADIRQGLEVYVYSEVPVASGMASSAALEVSFAKLLDEFYGTGLKRDELAELCYVAENRIMGIPCGRLDQYGSAFGKAILLYPRPPVRVEELPMEDVTFVVVDSGIRHSVADIHPKRQEDINRGLRALMESPEVPESLKEKLGCRFDEPRWEEITLDEVEPYLKLMDERAAKRIVYTIKANESTMRAVDLIKRGNVRENLATLGEIMNEQHELMRNLYDLSLPQLEHIRDSMLRAGALGVKISGAGLGGCLIALVRDREEGARVLEGALASGAIRGWILEIDEGVRTERIP